MLGAITIGDSSVIGAGAVVLKDAPAKSLLVGDPAVVKPLSPRSDNTFYVI